MGARLAIALSCLGLASVARADEPTEGAQPKLIEPGGSAPAPSAREVRTNSHKGQLEVSARIGEGLRTIVTYDDKDYCGSTDSQGANGFATVCAGRMPVMLDLEVGYGVSHRIDVFVEARLALEADFPTLPSLNDGPHVFHLSPGARFYFNEGGRTKLFTTAQAVFDFSGYKDPATGDKRGTDIGLRNMSGIQLDLDRAYGLYFYVAETLELARWFELDLEAGAGVQVRFP